MGISTFLHLITPEEAEVIQLLPDETIKELLWALCDRPLVRWGDEEEKKEEGEGEGEGEGEKGKEKEEGEGEWEKYVDVISVIQESLLKEDEEGKKGGGGGKKMYYMECGSKFWRAEVVNSVTLVTSYGKVGADGNTISKQCLFVI